MAFASVGRLLIGTALAIGFAAPLSAQSSDAVSVDLSIGPGTGWGSSRNYHKTATAAADLVIAFGPSGQTGRVVGFTVGVSGSVVATDVCELNASNQCRPYFPDLAHFGGLAGFHAGNSNAAFRVMAGPVFFGGGGRSGLGEQAQLDGAVGFKHIALLAAARGNALKRFSGETLYMSSIELGLRIK